MKTAFFVIIAVLFSCKGWGQELSSSPAFPQDTGTVTITVNCNLGNQGFLAAGGTGVYAYMGLITSSSTSSSNWLHVPAACVWGTPMPLSRRRISEIINILYHPRYPVLFWSSRQGRSSTKWRFCSGANSGNIAQRNADGSDMFVPGIRDFAGGLFCGSPFSTNL